MFRTSGTEQIIDLGFLNVTRRTIESAGGDRFERIVIEHPGAVAIVPLVGDDVVLLRQYRAAADATILEIPAGKLDLPLEDREEAARRELTEETGHVARELTHLIDLWTSIGFCDERITIYSARGVKAGQRHPIGPEEEAAEVVLMPMEQALHLITTGEIADAKTVAGLLLAKCHRDTS